MSDGSTRRRLIVTVKDSHRPRIDDVARHLRLAGLEVHGVMHAIGMITGSASGDVSALKDIDGVQAVEPEPHFYIPPSDTRSE